MEFQVPRISKILTVTLKQYKITIIKSQEANSLFKKLHSELTGQLGEIADKIGSSCVEKARCYYEALEDARRSQVNNSRN